jgi:hypothetical protein
MTEVPKIVYDRLRAALPLPGRAAPEQAHPDADLLAAFAEQALSATERDGVLEHLALCGDCREVVALSLPAADMLPPQTAPQTADEDGVRTVSRAGAPAPHKLSFAWPTLRWTALAAGVVVAAAALLLHPGKLNQATLPSVNPQVATTAPPASGSQIASSSVPSSVPSSAPPSSITSSPTDQLAVMAKTDEAQPKSELRLSKKLKAGQVVTPSPQAESGLLADNKKDSGQANKPSAAPPASAGAFHYDARSSRAASETVEVSGAAAAVTTEPSAENALVARNNAPGNDAPAIEKAKPALLEKEVAEEEQKTPAAVVPGPARLQARNVMSAARLASTANQSLASHVTWAIKAGALQRSLDNGQNWQDALHADHPLLCYASHDEDVWTGGQAGILFHSANSGVTWVQVQPLIKARQLSSDITHIEVRNTGLRNDEVRGDVRGRAEIILSTSSNEVWSSADDGKTWDKK